MTSIDTHEKLDVTVSKKSVIAASFGNALEWYDFSVYAFFAAYISANFFDEGNAAHGLLATFMVFAAGFIARPIGGIAVGLVGDRFGRKAALMVSLATMGFGVMILAFTPPLTVIGVFAPILIFVGRLLQGFSAGGELGSASAFLIEQAPEDRKATYASWLQASMGISNLLSAVIGLAITSVWDDAVISEWAWRIPFVLGLLIIPVGLYIRNQLPETQAFKHDKHYSKTGTIFKEVIVHHWQPLLAGFGFSILWTVSVYAFLIYGPTYYKVSPGLHFSSFDTFLASAVANVVMVVGCVAFGMMADRIGRQRVLMISCAIMIFLPTLGLYILHQVPTLPVLVIIHSLIAANIAMFAGVAPSTLPLAFPTAVRSTGVSISYNIAAIGFAGFTPAVLTWAISSVSIYSPGLYVSLGAIVGLLCTPWLFIYIRRVAAQSEAAAATADRLIDEEVLVD